MNAGLAVATVAVAVGAVAQGVTGLGFGLVCAPFLVAVFGPAEGVRTAMALGLAQNVVLLARERRGLLVRPWLTLLVPAAAATPFIAAATRRLDDRVLTIAAGTLSIGGAVALAAGIRWRAARGWPGAIGAALVSSVMNVVGSISGPPIALFAVNADWPASRLRPTLQAYFGALNIVSLAVLGLPHFRVALWVAMAAGLVAGAAVARRIPAATARLATLGVAAIGGVIAIASA